MQSISRCETLVNYSGLYEEEKGIEKGMEKGRKEIALNLLTYNTPIDVIAKSTGLSIEEIKKLEQ